MNSTCGKADMERSWAAVDRFDFCDVMDPSGIHLTIAAKACSSSLGKFDTGSIHRRLPSKMAPLITCFKNDGPVIRFRCAFDAEEKANREERGR